MVAMTRALRDGDLAGMAQTEHNLGLARDALTAQAYALDVVGQNVANASTPGYVRRDVILQNRAAGTGGQPGGVVALGVRRSVDQFVDSRVFESAGLATSAQTRDNNLARIEDFRANQTCFASGHNWHSWMNDRTVLDYPYLRQKQTPVS